jgi:hypothetical protein
VTIASCPPSTPATRGVVVFVPATFKTQFLMFATVADAALVFNFGAAELFLNNSCRSVVFDALLREKLLNYLTAHITALFNGVNGAIPGGLVGRISDAAEGSDSVSAEFPINPSGAWFVQTPWGALYWTATAQYRTFRYIPPPAVCADVGAGFPFFPGCGGGC